MKPTSKTVNKKRATCLQHCRKTIWILRCCVFYHRRSNKVARFFCRGWQNAQHRYSTRFAAIPFFVARFKVPLDLLIFLFSFLLPLSFSITHFYVFVWVNYTTTILTTAALLALSKSIYQEIALNLRPGPHESRHFWNRILCSPNSCGQDMKTVQSHSSASSVTISITFTQGPKPHALRRAVSKT